MDRDLVELKELKREKLAYQQELISEYENICTKLGIESDRFLADQDHVCYTRCSKKPPFGIFGKNF